MKFLWCDIETTGIDPKNAGPFQVAFNFVYDKTKNGAKEHKEEEKIFFLNPLDIPGIEYSEEASKFHGYSKAIIESFEGSKTVTEKMASSLEEFCKYGEYEKLYFCGYNSNKFDFIHLESLFNHYGLDFNKYFMVQKLDVFEQVKRAGQRKVLPYLENRRLVTVAKFLNVNLTNAHDAMADIKATREVAKSLAKMGVPLK